MVVNDKQQILTTVREEFNRWEALLAGLSEEEITARRLPANLSIKDVMAHLMAWQQRSIARLEAALLDREPEFPEWPEGLDAESDDDVDQVNAWIYETHRDRPWSSVYQDWREGYLRFMELGEAIPEKDLLDPERYDWMEGRPVGLVLQSSYEHHHEEHLGPLLAWLREQGNRPAAGESGTTRDRGSPLDDG